MIKCIKYKRMGWIVCFSFMVDGFEDTWLFISAQNVEVTDFRKNLEEKEIKFKIILNNFKEKFFILIGK